MSEAPRRIWLCADDYGISPGVNRAIRDLIERGRLNATSAMMVTPAIGRDGATRRQESAATNTLPSAARRIVPAFPEAAARRNVATARPRNHSRGSGDADCGIPRPVR